MKKRTLSVRIDSAKTHKSWANTQLVIDEYGDSGIAKSVTVRIGTPADLTYLRDQLDSIERYWRECLGERT